MDLKYNKKLILDKDNINNLGYILSYSYSKFDDFKILDKKVLNNYVQQNQKIDAINHFYSYCNKNGKSPIDNSILEFLESQKYQFPGEFIFLINIFEYIQILEIDMNIEIEQYKEEYDDDFYLIIITLLNIHYLAILTNYFKVNFINLELQKDIYSYFTDELNSIYKCNNIYIKKNNKIAENELYKKNGI